MGSTNDVGGGVTSRGSGAISVFSSEARFRTGQSCVHLLKLSNVNSYLSSCGRTPTYLLIDGRKLFEFLFLMNLLMHCLRFNKLTVNLITLITLIKQFDQFDQSINK